MSSKSEGRPKLMASGISESASNRVLPSAFLRRLRPEYYSDSVVRDSYELDKSTLEYHLDTLTARNETHDFEIFCRKLCERVICPNLRPSTGPEGGGDSKVDTETYGVAEEICELFYIGKPKTGSERWAFAFSAKKRWKEKVKSDVAGIISTGRKYDRIICITSQFARAKDRADLEDTLGKVNEVPVEIHDRSWIVKEIIEHNRRDLAFNFLGIGKEVADKTRLGPIDYSRSQQLEEMELALAQPDGFQGIENQKVTEAIVCAKLARELEYSRIEIDGRFERAKRLANRFGTHRQQLEVEYETMWTAFWWFDDFLFLNASYDEFEALFQEDEHVRNLEFLSTITQLLVNSVVHGHMTLKESRLLERSERLCRRLTKIAEDQDQPNSALEASTLLALWKINLSQVCGETSHLPEVWSEFSSILDRAAPMGEYDAERLIKLIGTSGRIAGNDPNYNLLVEKLAVFVGERRNEAEAAKLLLDRAKQLNFDQSYEMIRLLGKAVPKLTKSECDNELVEALQLLALAYRSSGLLWASRSTCLMAAARIAIEIEEESELKIGIIPFLHLWAWLSLQLRHVPDLVSALKMFSGFAAVLLNRSDQAEKLNEDWQKLDLALASLILSCSDQELACLDTLPDSLDRSQLPYSRAALLFSLGYEDTLREEEFIPGEEEAANVTDFFTTILNQPISMEFRGPLICNVEGEQSYETKVSGLTVRLSCNGSEVSLLVAEVVVSALEGFFATTLDLRAIAHTEVLEIQISECKEIDEPDFQIDAEQMKSALLWPIGRRPGDFRFQKDTVRFLLGFLANVLGTTCFVSEPREVLHQLCKNELAQNRVTVMTIAEINYHRLMGRPLSRLSTLIHPDDEKFPLRSRPKLQKLNSDPHVPDVKQGAKLNHRQTGVRSIIDVHLWDTASWKGTAFFCFGGDSKLAPVLSFMFENREAAQKIFERWRERFGDQDVLESIHLAIIRNVTAESPAHYEVLVTSSLPNETNGALANPTMFIGRHMKMEAESSNNLDRFLREYGRVGSYVLAPSYLEGGIPRPLMSLGISKKRLVVRDFADIGANDIEAMAFPSKEKRSSA